MKEKSHAWQTCCSPPTLRESDVHVWQSRLNLTRKKLDRLYKTLCKEEKLKANRFRFQEDCLRYVTAHGLLREIISGYLNLNPEDLEFLQNKYGKPYLKDPTRHNLEFNLSHSSDVVLLIFSSNRKVGIDVERVRVVKKSQKIIDRFFGETDRNFYNLQEASNKERAFFKLWTRKEAYTKAIGVGLKLQPKQFEAPSALENVPLTSGSRLRRVSGCLLSEIKVDPEYAATLVTEGSDYQIVFIQYSERS